MAAYLERVTEMSQKHAYLVMAHNDFESLQHLLMAIDDKRNDIFLHIDKKTKYVNYDEIRSWLRNAGLFFVPRTNVRWGHTSFVKCELLLFEQATNMGHYHYYHLISGIDYPIKSQNFIHESLKNQDEEFLSYHHNGDYDDDFMYKLKYYHFFMRWVGRGHYDGPGKKAAFLRWLTKTEWALIDKQSKRGIDRTKKYKNIDFVKGSNWKTVTDEFARFLVANKRRILKEFRFTNTPDEVYAAMVAMNSELKEKVANNSLRKIDWNRGNPYEYTYSDLEELLKSEEFFARKISYSKDPRLVRTLKYNNESCEIERFESNPLISVVVPIYNVRDYLEECLESIALQTYKSIEVLMIDDGSNDGSKEIAKAFSEKDKRFLYIYQENQGLSAARNTGIEASKGEYLVFVDSDDWVEKDFIQKLYENIMASGADVSVCGYFKDSEVSEEIVFDEAHIMSRTKAMGILGNIFPKEYLLMVLAWNKLYRKSVFDNVRYANGKIHEDEYIIHRIIDNSEMVSTITEPLYHYRIRNDSITGSKNQADLRHFDIVDAHRDRVNCCRGQIYSDIYKLIVYSFFEEILQLMFRYDRSAYKEYHLNSRFRWLMLRECILNYKELDKHQKKEYLLVIISPTGYVNRINRIMAKKRNTDSEER